mmetsp:Transcript_55494/g.104251  ORF Transcript_55494/g.104251 Transcript_55494/m.104251 type:complete len:227 (-) Transcript_55494:1025-1705(-)
MNWAVVTGRLTTCSNGWIDDPEDGLITVMGSRTVRPFGVVLCKGCAPAASAGAAGAGAGAGAGAAAAAAGAGAAAAAAARAFIDACFPRTNCKSDLVKHTVRSLGMYVSTSIQHIYHWLAIRKMCNQSQLQLLIICDNQRSSLRSRKGIANGQGSSLGLVLQIRLPARKTASLRIEIQRCVHAPVSQRVSQRYQKATQQCLHRNYLQKHVHSLHAVHSKVISSLCL